MTQGGSWFKARANSTASVTLQAWVEQETLGITIASRLFALPDKLLVRQIHPRRNEALEIVLDRFRILRSGRGDFCVEDAACKRGDGVARLAFFPEIRPRHWKSGGQG